MIIKCEYELGNYGQVVSESRIFERNFPESRYLPDVLFERAKALIKKQQFSPAMLSGIRILSISSDEALRSDAMDLCEDLSRYYLSPRELEMLLPLVIGRESLSYFKLLLCPKLYYCRGPFKSGSSAAGCQIGVIHRTVRSEIQGSHKIFQ
ncbi:MAG: hypothetical protein U5N26_00725 [Candidatus Marinimicrobia bacterium]|nr:hypothetical protein [Candidatus Neomarinimicrobiota bacterium]